MSKMLYRVKIDFMKDKTILYEMPIIKETEKSYVVERCDGSDYGKIIPKDDYNFSLTKEGAIKYFIDKKLEEQTRLAKKIKENESHVKQAEELLKEV